MKKKIKLKELRKKAVAIFHKWIVKRDNFQCFTCGGQGNQAGHFQHGKLDFDERNLHCQCVRCNYFMNGNLGMYAIKLDGKYGFGTAAQVMKDSHSVSNNFNRTQLEEIIKKYKPVK